MRAISSLDNFARLGVALGSTSPVSLWRNTVIGTPQARWRETTQSGRPSTMPRMRRSPDWGTHSVSPIALLASWRRLWLPLLGTPLSGLSMAMNHCGVLRKMTGFLERQECGY